jgi:uncharacterized protein YoxC
MEPTVPLPLQVVLYVASLAIVVWTAVLVGVLFRLLAKLERIVGAVEQLNLEIKPLAQEARDAVRSVHDLSDRANHWAGEVGDAVEPPLFAATRSLRILRSGVETFMRVLLDRKQRQQEKARQS